MEEQVLCPNCKTPMNVVVRNKSLTEYKCKVCGHITIVQDIERNDVGGKKKDNDTKS